MNPALSIRVLALCFGIFIMTDAPHAQTASNGLSVAAVEEVLNRSLAEKKGMSIYVGGKIINAIFVRRIDANTIEVRNQNFNRIIIRIDRIDAIAVA